MDTVASRKERAYSPNKLLDTLTERLQVVDDAALARKLNVTKSVIKKIRCNTVPVGGSLLIRMHDVSSIKIEELRRLMGDRRRKLRVSALGAPSNLLFKRASVPVERMSENSALQWAGD